MRAARPLALLSTLLAAAAAAAAGSRRAPAAAPPAASPAGFTRLGPGGWGVVTFAVREPSSRRWLAGTDVGGVFGSDDDGASWAACGAEATPGLNSTLVYAAAFLGGGGGGGGGGNGGGGGAVVLGSSAGAHLGAPVAGGCGYAFAPPSPGLLPANGTEALASSGRGFATPVRAVAASADGAAVWAGVGVAKGAATLGAAEPSPRRGDPHHVYRSADGGRSFAPSLRLPRGLGSIASLSAGGDGSTAFASSAEWGVFGTEDGGGTWTELGVARPLATSDGGASWARADAPGAAPRCADGSDAGSSTTGLCLPVLADFAGTARADARTVLWASPAMLYVTVWDGRAAPAAACPAGARAARDPSLALYRGGPYLSRDGGRSFQWLLKDESSGAPRFDRAALRCADGSEVYDASNLPALAADPAHPDHFVLGGSGASPGLLEGVVDGNATLRWWTGCGGADGAAYACFEGGRPDSYQSDTNTIVFGLHVADWASNESRSIDGGKAGPIVQTPGLARPLVALTTSRGALRAGWDAARSRYGFKHLNNNLADGTASPPLWQPTGLGDTCVWDAAFVDGDAKYALLAVADGGLARTVDGGASWQRVSEGWPGVGATASLGTAVLASAPDGCTYAAHLDRGATNLASVFRSCDGEASWALAGGYDAVSGERGANGLLTNASLAPLVAVPAAHDGGAAGGPSGNASGNFRMFAGGESIFVYDPQRAAGAQWRTLPASRGCDVQRPSQGPVPLPGAPASAFVVACAGGLFVLDASSGNGDVGWVQVALSAPPSRALTAVVAYGGCDRGGAAAAAAANTTVTLTLCLALGTRNATTGMPTVLSGTLSLSLAASGAVLSATAAVATAMDAGSVLGASPAERTALSKMQVLGLLAVAAAAAADGGGGAWRVYAGLNGAAYFDGYAPPALFESVDGGRSFKASPQAPGLPRLNVAALVTRPGGGVCAALDGNGLVCFPPSATTERHIPPRRAGGVDSTGKAGVRPLLRPAGSAAAAAQARQAAENAERRERVPARRKGFDLGF